MPAPLPANDVATLVLKLEEMLTLLGRCAVRHAGAVNAYVAAREATMRWNEGER